jgi:AmmeMemoRadiSam system protein B
MKRRAYLSGQWYPQDAKACEKEILLYTQDVNANVYDKCGLIGPHAGWRFSGQCAARAYKSLEHLHKNAELVVIFGSHKSPSAKHSIFTGNAWETPFGDLESSPALNAQLSENEDFIPESATPSFIDNAVEVHLPFIKYFFPHAKLLMIGASPQTDALRLGEKVGAYLAAQNVSTVFVGSTDLTHYGPNYRFVPKGSGPKAIDWVRHENDLGFIEKVLEKNPTAALSHGLEQQSACCPGAVVATMQAIKAYQGDIAPELLEHLLSYDVLPSDSFVGYASIVL